MPKLTQTYGTLIKEYTERMRSRNNCARYIREAEKSLKRSLKVLDDRGVLAQPANLPRDTLLIIRDSIPIGRGGSQRYRQYHTAHFYTFANWCGARLEPLPYPEQIPYRPRSSQEEYIAAREAAYQAGDIRAATLLLYLGLTARRGAALKALPEDIQPTYVLIRDKGRGGGKERTVPIGPVEYAEFRQYLAWRQNRIMEVLENNPQAEIPRHLFINPRKGWMSDLKKTKMDQIVDQCGRRVGVYMRSHMIRRMACRELYIACQEADEPIETAMAISGHSQAATFRIYVGAIEDRKANLRDQVIQARTTQKRIQSSIRQ